MNVTILNNINIAKFFVTVMTHLLNILIL